MTRPRPATLLLLGLGLGPSCQDDAGPELPPLSVHGTYVSMGIDGEAEPCAGTLPWLDRHVERLGALFERDVSDVSIAYYWLRAASLLPECGLGCTYSESEIHATFAVSEHEIAHAVVYGWVGVGESFFNEGLAVASSDYIYGVGQPDEAEQIREMIGADRSVEVDYPTAGMFVTYLFETWSPPTYLEFYAQTEPDDDYAAVASAFEQVYGLPLDEVIDAFLATAAEPGVCLGILPACTLEPIPWVGEQWTAEVEVSCGSEALGPNRPPDSDDGDLWQFVTVDIPADGTYLLESSTVSATFFPCGPCAARGPSAKSSMIGEPGVEASMRAGRYVARLRGLPGVEIVHQLTIRPAP